MQLYFIDLTCDSENNGGVLMRHIGLSIKFTFYGMSFPQLAPLQAFVTFLPNLYLVQSQPFQDVYHRTRSVRI